MVIKRVEVTRGEYSYDNAVNTIVNLNKIYKPAFIYADAGAGEYQIERLHILGDQDPSSGLKNKVKRCNFSQSLDVTDPVTFETTKEPLKQFMVNQLTISFERDRMIMSPFDDVLYKQLTDYEVVRRGQNGKPIFTSENEHFIDALGLAHLAFVLEFKELTKTVKDPETSSKIEVSNVSLGQAELNRMFNSLQRKTSINNVSLPNSDEPRGERQTWIKLPNNFRKSSGYRDNWGSRNITRNSGSFRSTW